MVRKKNKRSLTDKELDFQLRMGKIENICRSTTSILNNVLKWGGLTAISICAYLSILAVAGKSTFANIAVTTIHDIKISKLITASLVIMGVSYGLFQRHLRRANIERMAIRIDKLERKINPQKGSSKIARDGKTNREDE